MPRISAELLSQPVPFTSMDERQLIRDSATERQQILKANELDFTAAENKERVEKDYMQATEALTLLSAGSIEDAAKVLRRDGPEDKIGNTLADQLEQGDTQSVAKILNEYRAGLTKTGAVSQKLLNVAEGNAVFDPNSGQEVFRNPKEPKEQVRPATAEEKAAVGIAADIPAHWKNGEVVPVSGLPKPSEAGDVRSRKIADLRRQGLTDAQAVNLVDGHTRTEVNEKTGQLVTIDEVSRSAQEVPLSSDLEPVPEPEPGRTLWDLAPAATGFTSGITGKVASAMSFFGVNPEQATTGAQQMFKTETQNLIRAMAINPRFPVGEMERIREEIDIQPKFFRGTGVLRERMESVGESLKRRMEQAERDAKDPNLDTETRQAQRSNASAIRNFLPILGVPDEITEDDKIDARIQELEEKLGLSDQKRSGIK